MSYIEFVIVRIVSFMDIGISRAMLQLISLGFIAGALFFLADVTHDRTITMILDKINNIGQVMPKVFALFPIGAIASLALPGMSSFASELSVCVGIASSDIYSSIFHTVTVFYRL